IGTSFFRTAPCWRREAPPWPAWIATAGSRSYPRFCGWKKTFSRGSQNRAVLRTAAKPFKRTRTLASHSDPARVALVLLRGALVGGIAHCRGDAEESPGFLFGARPGFAHRLDYIDSRRGAFRHPTPA